ncbi:hypothetical protein AAFF_G00426990 [Aldrovandia affinis]|uniref:Reverse transcriptase domain-containing protein n=1 Tax=Aldrovandia affinis TaxID=143900 RepID=A0AAD7WJM2_9TELE|nr:hypothetical protein AAFF_G00426990 [Aldrovandia affinis]
MYRIDGRLFNLNRFKAKSKVLTSTIMELQYADDNALVAHSEADLQSILNAFARAYRLLALDLNIKKIDEHSKAPTICVENNILENVDHYICLGSLLSTRAVIDAEIHHRIGCASGAFARLRKRVFEDQDIQTKTNILIY